MKRFNTASVLGALFAWLATGLISSAAAAEAQGSIGLSIVYDTSGSMRDSVKNAAGKTSPKFEIANRALLSIVDRLDAFHRAHPGTGLKSGLVIFTPGSSRWAVPFGDFDPVQLRGWITAFSKPEGDTPLGEAVQMAARPLASPAFKHRHILVVTDGQNTAGRDPALVIADLRKKTANTDAQLGIHFVAFDVSAKVFEPVKKLDVTVVSAADEKQLDQQLTFILEQKVLLEDEEAPRPRP